MGFESAPNPVVRFLFDRQANFGGFAPRRIVQEL
jgi:hypothetical protein